MTQAALSGIKVVDLSRVLAGPSATQCLADLGAEVIKIERPETGDETREWAPPQFADGTSAYFATVNRNKQSVTVDISTAAGQEIIKKMVVDADVLVENYKVGGLKKYGLDYDSLKTLNPSLVYASLTGFGQTGPDARKPGYDYIIQGQSGLMSITGPEDGLPYKVGVAVVDLFAGLNLVIGIQAALLARAQTGVGQHVDVALLDSAIAMLANVGMNHLATGKVPPRLGNGHPSIVPYQVFATEGAQHLILACGNDKQFAAVCVVMEQDWIADERFATNPQRVKNRAELVPLMQTVFMSKERDAWLGLFDAASVPCGPINNIAEAVAMPQVAAREMVVGLNKAEVQMNVLGSPVKLSGTPVQYHSAPPDLGQDTVSVLTSLGYTQEQIEQLQQQHIV
jgi:formyl-CoA transferase